MLFVSVADEVVSEQVYGYAVGRTDGTVWEPSSKSFKNSRDAKDTIRPMIRMGGEHARISVVFDPDVPDPGRPDEQVVYVYSSPQPTALDRIVGQIPVTPRPRGGLSLAVSF